MKKTINVNIGSLGFTIDEDAYQLLKIYLQDIRSRLNDTEQQEVMNDVETRIADIFKENTSFSNQVVGTDLVRRAIGVIGRAADFGEPRRSQEAECSDSRPSDSVKRIYRSRSERMLGGVCGGLAKYINADVTIVRIIFFILLIFGGVSFLVYIVMWIIIPQEPMQLNYFNEHRK